MGRSPLGSLGEGENSLANRGDTKISGFLQEKVERNFRMVTDWSFTKRQTFSF